MHAVQGRGLLPTHVRDYAKRAMARVTNKPPDKDDVFPSKKRRTEEPGSASSVAHASTPAALPSTGLDAREPSHMLPRRPQMPPPIELRIEMVLRQHTSRARSAWGCHLLEAPFEVGGWCLARRRRRGRAPVRAKAQQTFANRLAGCRRLALVIRVDSRLCVEPSRWASHCQRT